MNYPPPLWSPRSLPTPFLSSKWHRSLKWFALTEENSVLLTEAIMERIPYWFVFFYSVIWCILAHYICLHVSNVGYCDLILVQLKPIFSKSLIISLKDLFHTSASSQKGAVTRFNFLPEIIPKWIKYIKHWFFKALYFREGTLICPNSLPTEANSNISRRIRGLIFHHLPGRCRWSPHGWGLVYS